MVLKVVGSNPDLACYLFHHHYILSVTFHFDPLILMLPYLLNSSALVAACVEVE
jgi:hypothetical protein